MLILVVMEHSFLVILVTIIEPAIWLQQEHWGSWVLFLTSALFKYMAAALFMRHGDKFIQSLDSTKTVNFEKNVSTLRDIKMILGVSR